MPELIQVPTGTTSDQMYLVTMDEDLWLAYPDETKEYCKSEWRKKATALKGVRYVGLRVVPDELFPSGNKEHPYFAWQATIERESAAPFTVHLEATVALSPSVKFTPMYQAEIVKQLAVRYGAGTRWVIRQGGETLAMGKL